jgi:outer membrane protein assembly factor BamB
MAESENSPGTTRTRLVSRNDRKIRWWPALLILLAGAAAWTWIWFFAEVWQQEKNIRSSIVGFVTFVLLLLWLLFLSRFRWKIRFAVFGTVAGVIVLMIALFKIRGVTGDLWPVLDWRWRQARDSGAPHDTGPEPRRLPAIEPEKAFQSGGTYPQFLGPDRNGTVPGPKLARDWTIEAPKQLWRQPIGPAWSGFSIVGNRAITQEQWGEKEMVVCYELSSGKKLWSHEDSAHYHTTIAGEGPRATPTIVRNHVYSLGATGILNCLEVVNGKRIWFKDIVQDNHSRTNEWGMSGSPLVVDDLVVVSAGGANGRSLVAYHRENGTFVWGGGNDSSGYSSPCLASLGGVRQILIFNSGGVASHNPETGDVLWKYPWPKGHPHVVMPLVLPNDRVLVSSGYGTGSELLQVNRNPAGGVSVSRVWKSIRLKSKFANPVFHDGHIYGLDDGILVCVDAADGTLKWKEGRYGHGQLILIADLLLVTAENGELALLEPRPTQRRELSRFSVLKGKTWNPPALAGQYLLVRNDQEAACYQLPVAKPLQGRSIVIAETLQAFPN